ncbi:MAG: FG-GAP repeat protein [Limnohabitans sp.]|nr:FG-GAP repeat protein [Limnohabitans sp.]
MRYRAHFLRLSAVVTIAVSSSAAVHAQTLNDLYPELATLVASDGAIGDDFGDSVSLSGDTLAVGVPDDAVGANVNQGSVRVFVRNGTTWIAQATLTASDGAVADFFGSSVSLSGDTLAVGVPYDDVGVNGDQGSVRVFVRSGTTWTAQATLTASDGVSGDFFGSSVSLLSETLAVGAKFDDVGANSSQGSVRVFVRGGTTWTAQATLSASDGAPFDYFGSSVSLSGDTLAVGVPEDAVGANVDQGSVRVFVRNGTIWTAQATLTASDGAVGDAFGSSVSLSGDTLAVGVPEDAVGANVDQGSVRVFVRSGTVWTAQATLVASDGAVADLFGSSVSLSGDTLVIGVPYDDVGANSGQGSVRVFVRNSTTWTAQATLTAFDGAPLDLVSSVSLSGDMLAVGVPRDDVGVNGDQGSVRVFGNYRVFNDTTNVGYQSLVDAIAGSLAGARLLCGAPAFAEATGIVDASQKRFAFVALEPLVLAESALMSVATNTVFEKSPNVAAGGLTIAGKLIAPNAGNLTFEQFTVANEGQFTQRNANVFVNQTFGTTSGGVCYLEGPVLAEAVTTAVGAQNRVMGDTSILSDYTNAGSTIIQRGILYIYGTLTNTGTLTGEVNNGFLPPAPGDGYSIGGDYALSADSSLVLPDPVWWLRVGGDLDIAINSPTRFVMDQATIELTGLGDEPSQTLEVFARDLGAVDAGFAASNYLLGALRIRAGATVELVDNHNNAITKGKKRPNEAIYTNELFVPAGATLVTNGYRIYTRAATIAGTVSDPADVIVVPDAPPCAADLFPNGIVDAADLGIMLSIWGPCTGACVADLDGDGQVGASDLSTLLAAWGPCAN